MKKLLYYGDTPNIGTGFGNVARHVLGRVQDQYDITVFGVNEFFTNSLRVPCRLISPLPNAANDPFGRQKFIELVLRGNEDWDVWWLQNDIHFWYFLPDLMYALWSRGRHPHVFIYTVVDSPVNRMDVYNLSVADVCGVPSQYGINQVAKVSPEIKYKLRHIPHGIDPKEFFPLPEGDIKAHRANMFRCGDEHFLVANVNRNASRKDIPRTLLYFTQLNARFPQTRLYLHMQMNEEKNKGFDLDRILFCNENSMKNVSTPMNFTADQGVPTSVLNVIYNCADLIISTTVGEGFGLSCIEAMATRTPILMPDNTALSELMGADRGIPVKCGTSLSEWTILTQDPGFPRPLVNIEDMLAKTAVVIKEYPEEMIENAYQWVTNDLHWDKVVQMFVNGFEEKPHIDSVEGRIEV